MGTICLWEIQWRSGAKISGGGEPKIFARNFKSLCGLNLNLRCLALTKPAERVLSALRNARGNGPAISGLIRKSTNLSRAARLSALDDLLRREDWDLALPVSLLSYLLYHIQCFQLGRTAFNILFSSANASQKSGHNAQQSSTGLGQISNLSGWIHVIRSCIMQMYRAITEADWYRWNARLHARVIALLEKFEQQDEAQSLFSEAKQKLGRVDKVRFYCSLIECYSKCGLKDQILSTYNLLQQLPREPVHVIGYKSLIRALAVMNLPHEAEEILREMEGAGYNPSPGEFKVVLHAYGKSGYFAEMERTLKLMEDRRHPVDTVTINMILGSYGAGNEYNNMKTWLKRMKAWNISLSVRTYNAVANACPTLTCFALQHEDMPLSTGSLLDVLRKKANAIGELSLVQELLGLGLLAGSTQWSSLDWRLDLHGMVPSAAYALLLVWLEEVKSRIVSEVNPPSEVSVVCGVGKHSMSRGDSPIKIMVSELMFKMRSPFKVDRYNIGRFVARGKTVKSWLC